MKPAHAHLPCISKLIASFILLSALTVAGAAGAETTLRVASYNIHAGRGADERIDLPRIAGVLRRLNADVILLQEVDMGTRRSGGVMQAAELGKLLGMNFYFAKAMDYGGGEFGNAILSRRPFARVSTLPLDGGAERRSAGIVEIILPARENEKTTAPARPDESGARVMIAGTHLDARKRETHPGHVKKISDEVARLAAARPCAAVIWGGDFNATEASPIWDVLTKERGWTLPQKQGASKAERATVPSGKPVKEIDWFLYRAGEADGKGGAKAGALSVVENRVVDERVASDHRPVVFALSFGGSR